MASKKKTAKKKAAKKTGKAAKKKAKSTAKKIQRCSLCAVRGHNARGHDAFVRGTP